jgi:hypothetical protein
MKKTFCFLMLVISIGPAFAQTATTNSDKIFDMPIGYPKQRFLIDLGKGNKMQIELAKFEDLKYFLNIDSVISVFLTDIAPLKDSLSNDLLSKRIDYRTDSLGRKKIRFQQFVTKGSSFVVKDGDVASLKLEQDTVNFIGTVNYTAKYSMRKAFADSRLYRLSFFLNNLEDLKTYMNGSLNKKILALKNNINSPWITTRTPGTAYLKAEPSISGRLTKGYVAGGDFLNFRASVELQNYKHYFVPSFTIGAGLILSNTHFKRDIILSWDPNFFFAKNAQGQLKTFRNDFLTLTWGQGFVRDNEPKKESHLLFIMSLGYLIKRQGEYYDKNTFRLGAGRFSLFEGKTKIEPVMYFNNFFKGVTPGVRLIQSF